MDNLVNERIFTTKKDVKQIINAKSKTNKPPVKWFHPSERIQHEKQNVHAKQPGQKLINISPQTIWLTNIRLRVETYQE